MLSCQIVIAIDIQNFYEIFPCTLIFLAYRIICILLPHNFYTLSSYLVIPKGKAADGEERESRLEAGALSSLFRRITGLRRDQHLIFWFWSDGRTDETGPDGSHTPLNWSIRKSWWSPRGSAGAFTVDRVQISSPSVFTSNSQEYNKFLLRLTIPSSLVLVRSSRAASYPSLSLSLLCSRHFSPFSRATSTSIPNL